MRAWKDVAELITTKTLNGGFVARCAAGLPFLLSEGMEVAFVPPRLDVPRRACVLSVRPQGIDTAFVTFEGVDSVDVANELVGCHCLVRCDDLPEGGAMDAATADSLRGFQVVDECEGLLGTLEDVQVLPGQHLLEVERVDAAPLLIPLVDEFVLDIDDSARRIDVRIPAGLLEL